METAAKWRELAEAKSLSIRELMIEVTGRASFVGTPQQVASQIEKAVALRAADGFILVPHVTPGGLDEFADTVVPILQERDRFRTDYEGPTLRDHLGLPPARSSRNTRTLVGASAHDLGTRAAGHPGPGAGQLGILRRPGLAQLHRPGPDRGALGYRRYWFAEHHLNPGVAGSTPALLIAMAAAATDHIRLGSGGVQSGHRTALSVVEDFGLLDAMYPGRIDLGIGRSGGRNFFRDRLAAAARHRRVTGILARLDAPRTECSSRPTIAPRPRQGAAHQADRGDAAAHNAESADYGDLIEDILGLLRGTLPLQDGLDPHPVPGAGAEVEPWILGSSAGESAEVAGRLGVRFAASYHISPATALEAAEAYRKAFVPSRGPRSALRCRLR